MAASRRHHCNGCQSLKFTRDRNGEIYTVRYDAVNTMLLNEFLKEHHQVQDLKATGRLEHSA